MEFDKIVFDREFDANSRSAKLLGHGYYSYAWSIPYPVIPGEDPSLVAIKVLDPRVPAKSGGDPKEAFIEEIKFLQKLFHPGIPRFITYGKCTFEDMPSHYHICEYVEGSVSLKEFLKVNPDIFKSSFDLCCRFAIEMLEILEYCHSQRILHLDIKPDNILIRYDAETKEIHCSLLDFGKAKYIFGPDSERSPDDTTTVAPVVTDYVHPDLIPFLRKNAIPIKMYGDGAQKFDLFPIGVIIENIIMDKRESERHSLIDDFKFVTRFIKNLKHLNNGDMFSACEALAILRRHLDKSVKKPSITIRLGNMPSVVVSKDAVSLIELPEFQRLRNISQLGVSHLVYPGATHTRFSHSIGVYGLAGMYAANLSNNYYFRFRYSDDKIKILQIKALLHDVGHYPFAHYLEELGDNDDISLEISHEKYTDRFIKGELRFDRSENDKPTIPRLIEDITKINAEDFIGIFDNDSLLNSIIDSPIDCDKLDYLLRDGFYAGLPYASSIDYDRFMSSLTCIGVESKYPEIGISSKGVAAAETVLMARYQLFSELYWHKTCRSISSMIKHAMWLIVENKLITQSDYDYAVLHYGDNVFLQWLSTVLSTCNSQAADKLINEALIGRKRHIYKRLITYSSIWSQHDKKRSPYHALIEKCHSYSKICAVKESIREALNCAGRSKSGWTNIEEHDLLLDIPPANKDLQEGIMVSYADDALSKGEYKLEEVSSILRDMSVSYLQYTKKIRLFAHPLIANQLYDLNDFKELVSDAIIGSLR